jgi:hypothetical protein
MSEIITQCKLIKITGLRSVYSICSNRLMYGDSSRLQETQFINIDLTNQRRLNGKDGNIEKTNLLSNKVERFELHADYFRDTIEHKSPFLCQ